MPTFDVSITNAGMFTAPGDSSAYQVELRFPPLRTTILGVEVAQPDTLGRRHFYASSSVLVWLVWEKPLPKGETLRVLVEYKGEPLAEPEIELFNASLVGKLASPSTSVPSNPDTAAPFAIDLLEKRRLQVDEDTKARLAQFVTNRRDEIESTNDPVRKFQMAFFHEFDLATNLVFIGDQKELAEQVEEAQGILVRRVAERAVNVGAKPGLEMPPEVVQRLSELQLAIIRGHFPGTCAGIDVAAFEDAFIAFSVGRLIPSDWGRWNGRPDSAFFFMFAEFAICFAECAICAAESHESRDAWLALLPTFVMCQDLYTKVFAPFCDTPPPRWFVPELLRTFGMYQQQDSETPPDIDQYIQEVLDDFASLRNGTLADLVNRHANNAHKSFPRGNVELADPCKATPSEGDHSLVGERTMSIDEKPDEKPDEKLNVILSAATSYVAAYTRANGGDEDPKYVLLDPTSLKMKGAHLVFTDRDLAQRQKDASHVDDHVVGPITLLYDVTASEGWYRTPIHHMLIVDRRVFVVGEKNGKTEHWEFPANMYDTYVVVVPK